MQNHIMYRILQIKINLVRLEWDYSIPFFTYAKLMQNWCWIHKKQSSYMFEQHCVE